MKQLVIAASIALMLSNPVCADEDDATAPANEISGNRISSNKGYSDADVARMPIWLEFDVTEQKIHNVDLGKIFVGKRVTGVVKISNKSNQDVSFTSVSSSCGCTAAIRSTDKILKGSTESVVVSAVAGAIGGFSSRLALQIGEEQYSVHFHGNPRYSLSVTEPRIALDTNLRGRFFVRIEDDDLSIDGIDIRVDTFDKNIDIQFLQKTNRLLEFAVTNLDQRRPVSSPAFVIHFDGMGSQPLQLHLTSAGIVSCRPSRFAINDQQKELRFFLSGDLNDFREALLGEPRTLKVDIQSKSLNVGPEVPVQHGQSELELTPIGSMARAKLLLPFADLNAGEHDITVSYEDTKFDFRITK